MKTMVPDMMVDRAAICFVRSRFTYISLFLFVLYVQTAILLPAAWLAEVIRCIQITLSAVVVMGYWRTGTRCFFIVGRWPEKQSVVALGILVSWFAICLSASWGLLWRLAGQPSWMVNNDFFTAWTAASAFAAALHIIAPNMVGVGIPNMDRTRYTVAAVIGAFLVVLVGLWRPNLSGVAEAARQLIEEPEWARRGLLHLWRTPRVISGYLG